MTFDHSLSGKIYERPALLCRPVERWTNSSFFESAPSLSFSLKHSTNSTILSLAVRHLHKIPENHLGSNAPSCTANVLTRL